MRQLPEVLQLDVAGNPQAWISYETSAYHYAKENIAWSMGKVDFDLRGGTSAKTGLNRQQRAGDFWHGPCTAVR